MTIVRKYRDFGFFEIVHQIGSRTLFSPFLRKSKNIFFPGRLMDNFLQFSKSFPNFPISPIFPEFPLIFLIFKFFAIFPEFSNFSTIFPQFSNFPKFFQNFPIFPNFPKLSPIFPDLRHFPEFPKNQKNLKFSSSFLHLRFAKQSAFPFFSKMRGRIFRTSKKWEDNEIQGRKLLHSIWDPRLTPCRPQQIFE